MSIESEQLIEGSSFKWRITGLLEVNELPNQADIQNQIIVKDVELKVKRDATMTEDKLFTIVNKSGLEIKLISVSLESKPNRFIRLVNEQLKNPVAIYQQHFHKVHFRVFPRQQGTFSYVFLLEFQVLDMEVIQKRGNVRLEVVEGNEVIYGERNVSMPRFIARKFEELPVPDEVRMIDFTNVNNATVEMLNTFPVLNEELKPENYLEKMKIGVYTEEIAMEQAFNKLRIKRARFENVGDLLRLEIKDVAEKRPSLIVGDKVWASDPKLGVESGIYGGEIKKVENDAILVSFIKEFHETHRGNEFAVEFKFSRRLFKQNHHALKMITTSSLGMDFLFPEIKKVESRFPQNYVTLDGEKLKLFGQDRPWFDQKLNQHQKKAVVNILQGICRPLPYIIYGPPGKVTLKSLADDQNIQRNLSKELEKL